MNKGVCRPAVFLDRDGTINADRPDYVKSLDEFLFLPRTFEALRLLATLNVPVIVITNQSQIGRGITDESVICEVNSYMVEKIRERGGHITDVYVCPHAPSEACDCRKPKPGLLFRASKEHRIELSRSFLVGDRVSDVGAALAAGCRSIFIARDLSPPCEVIAMKPEFVVHDLFEAIQYIEYLMRVSPEGGPRQIKK